MNKFFVQYNNLARFDKNKRRFFSRPARCIYDNENIKISFKLELVT